MQLHPPSTRLLAPLAAIVCAVLGSGCSLTGSERPALFSGGLFGGETARPNVYGDPYEGLDEYEVADELFAQQRYDEAEDEFRRIARRYRDKPIEEDAMFMIAECQFFRRRYPAAQDSYGELFKKYPNTRHVEVAAARLFQIGRHFLGTDGDQDQPPQWALVPNVTDRSYPLFDSAGRGLESLRSVWLHDPTGPLADDAVMMTAQYYFLAGDYVQADHYYSLVRDEFPDSDHQPEAHLFGAQAKLLAYRGAGFDSTGLDEADAVLRSALRRFPEELAAHREQIDRMLAAVYAMQAEQEFQLAAYYQRRGDPDAALLTYRRLIARFPESRWAAAAQQRVAQLGGDDWQGASPLAPDAGQIFQAGGAQP